ncbi:MAG: hypothetical protein WD425_18710 [Nitrospirales bacterium]
MSGILLEDSVKAPERERKHAWVIAASGTHLLEVVVFVGGGSDS